MDFNDTSRFVAETVGLAWVDVRWVKRVRSNYARKFLGGRAALAGPFELKLDLKQISCDAEE